jgi:hypothetical protein
VKTENWFAVSRYENRNGVSSWRVAGWLHGVRIRKNFKTKEERRRPRKPRSNWPHCGPPLAFDLRPRFSTMTNCAKLNLPSVVWQISAGR